MGRKTLTLFAVVLTAFSAGAIAQAASGWKPFATGSDSGQYGAYASASGDVVKPKGLAVRARASAGRADLSWDLICNGEIKQAKSGTVYVVGVIGAQKCTLDGSANTDSGSVTVQLLKR